MGILLVAAGLRGFELGRLSLWFDEVVSMRVARAPGLGPLLTELRASDATRAPLHPIVLKAWLGLFGTSDTAGRALSVGCGLLTVALVARIGRLAFDRPTGLWAAALAAFSPLLVQYAREARMYALLTLLATAAWALVFEALARGQSPRAGRVAYGAALVALAYTHPLGLLMVATLAVATLAARSALGLGLKGWLIVHGLAALAIAPWVPNYLDHAPDVVDARWLSPAYLIGLPIGFIGGNRWALLGCLVLAAVGMLGWPPWRVRWRRRQPLATALVLAWFVIPPLLLYGYSWLRHPVFGPARYTLFVGPAYLLLLGRGLAAVPRYLATLVLVTLVGLAVPLLRSSVTAPDLKADWRVGAAEIRQIDPEGASLVVYSEDPRWSREVDVARYYLGPLYEVTPALERPADAPPPRWYAVGLRAGRSVARLPAGANRAGTVIDVPGLRLVRP